MRSVLQRDRFLLWFDESASLDPRRESLTGAFPQVTVRTGCGRRRLRCRSWNPARADVIGPRWRMQALQWRGVPEGWTGCGDGHDAAQCAGLD